MPLQPSVAGPVPLRCRSRRRPARRRAREAEHTARRVQARKLARPGRIVGRRRAPRAAPSGAMQTPSARGDSRAHDHDSPSWLRRALRMRSAQPEQATRERANSDGCFHARITRARPKHCNPCRAAPTRTWCRRWCPRAASRAWSRSRRRLAGHPRTSRCRPSLPQTRSRLAAQAERSSESAVSGPHARIARMQRSPSARPDTSCAAPSSFQARPESEQLGAETPVTQRSVSGSHRSCRRFRSSRRPGRIGDELGQHAHARRIRRYDPRYRRHRRADPGEVRKCAENSGQPSARRRPRPA